MPEARQLRRQPELSGAELCRAVCAAGGYRAAGCVAAVGGTGQAR